MKKRKFYTIFPLAAVSVLALTSCNLEANPPSEGGSDLITAINYNAKQRIVYSLDESYTSPDSPIEDPQDPTKTIPGGGPKTFTKGDNKPFWEYVQNKLGIVLKEHAAAANSGEKKSVAYFRDNWLNKPYADITMGTVNAITKYAVSGNKETILDLRKYMFDENLNPLPESETKLPNLQKFLKENYGVMTSIMTAKHSKADQAALYFVPYCDGFDDIERQMNVREDYIIRLLDGKDEAHGTTEYSKVPLNIIGPEGSGAQYTLNYEPYIKDDEYDVYLPNVNINTGLIDTEKHEGAKSYKFTKQSCGAEGSIITRQNKLFKRGNVTPEELAGQFKDYIDERYITPYTSDPIFNNRSDLFLGYKACYDTDELIALMRLVKYSSKTLYGDSDDKEMVTWFPTEWTNMRSSDLYRWGGQVFGVRGTDSRTGYLYFNGLNTFKEGFDPTYKIHDCRGDEQMVNLIKQLQGLYKEGLLMQDFDSVTATGTNNKYFYEQLILDYADQKESVNKKYHGFMEYYTANSESKLNDYNDTYKKKSDKRTENGTVFGPMIGAVTQWDVNGDGKLVKGEDPYMQFTESWISAKTSGLCLNAELENNEAKRNAAFKLIDYIFSPEGKADYNYGPMTYGYYYHGTFNKDGNFELSELGKKQKAKEVTDKLVKEERPGTITYKGKVYPQYTFKAEEEMKKVDGVTRERIGITMPFGYEKMNAAIYQQTRETSRPSIDRINVALDCGTFKHTCINPAKEVYKDDLLFKELEKSPDKMPFFKIIPASFYLTDGQNTDIARILDKTKLGSMYTDDNQSQFNIWDDYVMGKKSASAPEFSKYLETVNGSWECPKLVTYYQQAYELMA